MATIHPLQAPASGQPREPGGPGADATDKEQALVPSHPQREEGDLIAPGGPVARLPVELDVSVPVREFRVRNLLALGPGQLIETQWARGEDMPLASGEVQLAWSEFEVINSELAVRVTRLV